MKDPAENQFDYGIRSSVDNLDLVDRRRHQITKAAIEIFIKYGFGKATVRHVAKEAGVSVGLIYQYIGEKEDLMFLALAEIAHAYNDKIPAALVGIDDPLRRFLTTCRTYCRVHNSSSGATVLVYRETASLTQEHRNIIMQIEMETNDLVASCVVECIEAGLFKKIDVDLFTWQVVMFSHTWALKSWSLKSKMTIDEYIQRGLRLMLAGVLSEDGLIRLRELEPGFCPDKLAATS